MFITESILLGAKEINTHFRLMVCGVLPLLSIFYQKPSEKNRN